MRAFPLIAIFFLSVFTCAANADETSHYFSIQCKRTIPVGEPNIIAIDVIEETCKKIGNGSAVGKSTANNNLSGVMLDLNAMTHREYAFYWDGVLIDEKFGGSPEVDSYCSGVVAVQCSQDLEEVKTDIYEGATNVWWDYHGNFYGFNDVYERPSSDTNIYSQSAKFNLFYEREWKYEGEWANKLSNRFSLSIDGHYYSEIDSSNSGIVLSKESINASGSDEVQISPFLRDFYNKEVWCQYCGLTLASTKGSILEDGQYLGPGPGPFTVTLRSDNEPGTAVVSASWNGGTFDVTRSIEFVDSTPPTLASATPIDNAAEVNVSDDLVLTFSEDIAAGTGSIVITDGDSDTRTIPIGDAQVTIATNTVTISPASNLSYSTGYSIQLASGVINDTAGNAYAGIADSTTLNFTTAAAPDTTAPALVSATPRDDANEVNISDDLVLEFSENIVAETGNISLFKADGTLVQAFDIAALPTGSSISGTTLTLDPSADLESSTGYYLQVTATAIDDAAGNSFAGIADATTLNFTSADVAAPTVTSVSVPSAGSYVTGNTLDFTVNTSENVTVTGSPQIALTIGSTVRQAGYASGSGSSALVFSYTIQAGDNDTDGVAVGDLSLNSGTLKDGAGNDMTLTLNSLGATSEVRVDTTAPTFASSTPTDGAVSVEVASNIALTFSENIVAGTGNVTLFAADGTFIQAFDIVTLPSGSSIAGTMLTLNPLADLESSTSYYVQVDATAIDDAAGNSFVGIADATTLNFTAADVLAPTLVSSTPADNQTEVATSTSQIALTFNENVELGSGNLSFVDLRTPSAAASTISVTGGSVSVSSNTATITLPSALSADGVYYLTVPNTAFEDTAGNAFAGIADSTGLNFSTTGQSAPTLSSSTPSDNATAVSTATNSIVLTFNENVVIGSGDLVLGSRGIPSFANETIAVGSAKVTGGGNVITISFDTTLVNDGDYYLQIPNTAFFDTFGTAYAGISTTAGLNFFAGTVAVPTLVSSTPADDATGVLASTSTIVLRFSENVFEGTGNLTLNSPSTTGFTPIVTAVGDAAISGLGTNEITLTFASALGSDRDYDLRIDSTALVDATGSAFAGISIATGLNFSTVDATAPTAAFDPGSSDTNQSRDTDVVLTFSESVRKAADATALNSDNIDGFITLKKDNASGADIAFDATISGNVVTINPSSTLPNFSSIYVAVTTGLEDQSGNALVAANATFVTLDNIAPTAPAITAGGGTSNDTTPTFSGTAEANNTVTLLVGGSSAGTTTANGSGAWSITLASGKVSAGANTLTATATDSAGNVSAASSSVSFTLDTGAPTVTIASSSVGSTLNAGQTATITFTFSESVTGFALDDTSVGGGALSVLSGSGASYTATFTPTPSSTADGTISVTGAGFLDSAGNAGTDAALVTAISIDTTTPTLSSSAPSDNATTVAVDSNIVLTFSESVVAGSGSVTLYDASDAVIQTFDITALPSGSTLSGSTLTLDPSAKLSSRTSYYVFIAANAIDDSSGNSFAGIADKTTLNFTTGDETAPAVTSVAVPASATYTAGETLSFTINTSEATVVNTGSGTPQLAIIIGGTTQQATYVSGSNSSALVFSYTVQAGDNDDNGIAIGTLALSGGTIRDATGNDLVLTLAGVAATTGVLVDALAPTVTSVAVPASGSYTAGANLSFIINASENIVVTTTGGTPQLALTIGGITRQATYLSGSGTSALLFRYTVQAGETDMDGIAVGTLSANGGTLQDDAGNDLTVTLNSVGATTGVFVDTSAPAAAALTTADTTTTTAAFEIAGSAEANSTIEVYVGSTLVGTATADGAGDWSFTFAAGDLSLGDNSITVIVEDAAGNRSAASTAITITLENPVPTETPTIELPFIPIDPIELPVIPIDPVIRDDLVLSGTLVNAEIGENSSVSGGQLCGQINSAGSVSNTSLCAGAQLTGGSVSGTIAGDASAPARISAKVKAGSTLKHVIIDKDAVLEPGVTLGVGVIIESLANIPTGTDLSALAKHSIVAVDLESEVTQGDDIGAVPLIERIRKLETLQGAGGSLEQDAESGALLINLPPLQSRLMPFKVFKAASSATPGIFDDEDGNIRIVVEGSLEIIAYPLFTDQASMKAAIDSYDQSLEMARFSNGNLQIRSRVNGDESNRFSGRPSLSAEDVTGRASEGWVFDVSRFVENREIASFVRTSEEQRLWEQGLVPRPEDWDIFKQTLLADPRIRRVAIGVNGLIEITFDRKPVCAVADYLVEPSLAGPNPNRPLVFIPSGDRNGDGVGDYHAYFPSGGRQLIYLLPSNTAIDRCQN
jgi:methionine-rich copper-binding protein CopC